METSSAQILRLWHPTISGLDIELNRYLCLDMIIFNNSNLGRLLVIYAY